MSDEAGIGPSERQVNTLSFQQLCHFQIFDGKPETLSPKERYQLIAVSNKYGYTFVGANTGCVKVIKTDDLARISGENQDSGCTVADYPHEKLATPGKPLHVAINSDETVLSVITKGDAGIKLSLYDFVAVCGQASSVKPSTTAGLTKEGNVELVDFLWNPVLPSLFAVCLSDGSANLWLWSEGKIMHLSTLPTAIKANAACWSPKGKQIVFGTADGLLMQFNHTMEHKKSVPKPDFANEPVKVVDILWLSTYMWAVAYIDVGETIQPNIVIVNAPKDQPAPSFVNFEDICYGSCEDRNAMYYMKFMDKWGFLITSSSNAMETGILGQRSDDKTTWDIWTLEDTGRIELPLCDGDDTLPMGFGLDLTSQREFITVNKQKHAPVPIFLILSTEGLLCPFHVINTDATESLQQKAEPLPGGGQQIVTSSAPVGGSTGVASQGSAQPAPSAAPSSASQQTAPAFSFKTPQTTSQGPSSVPAQPTATTAAAPFSFKTTQPVSSTGGFSFGSTFGGSIFSSAQPAPSAAPSSAAQQTAPAFSFKMPQTTSQGPSTAPAQAAATTAAAPFSFKPTQPTSSTGGFSFGTSPVSAGGAKVSHPTDETSGSGSAPQSKPFSFSLAATTTFAGGSQPQTTSGASPFSFNQPATATSTPSSSASATTAPQASPFYFAKPSATGNQAQTTAGASPFSFSKPATTALAGTAASQPKPFSFAQPQASTTGAPGQSTGGVTQFSFTKPAGTTSGQPFSFANRSASQTAASAGQGAGSPAFSFTKPAGTTAQPANQSSTVAQGPASGSFSFGKPQAQVVPPSATVPQAVTTATPTTQPPKYQAPATATPGGPKQGPPNQVAPVMRTLPFSVTEERQKASQVTLPRVQDAPKTPGNLSVTIPLEQRKGAMQAQKQAQAPGQAPAPAATPVAPQAEISARDGSPPAAVRERYAPVVEPVSPTSSVATSVGGEHLESALMSNIQAEMEHFDKEIDDLSFRTENGDRTIGQREELLDIRRSMDDLEAFRADVLECTKSLNEDVHNIKGKLLNAFGLLEESKIRKQRNRDPKFITLLKARGLDPETSAQMQEIRGMVHYLEVGTRDVNRSLDLQWEENTGRGKKNQSRKLATPTMDTIYHTLRNHHNIMATQRIALEAVREKLMRAQKYDPIGSLYGGALPSPKFRSDEVGPLALRLSETKLNSSRRARQTPASSKKQSMLRDILSRRTETPIRCSPKVLSREDEVSSPSLSYSSQRSYTPPVAFSKKLDFTDDARPAAAAPRVPAGRETPESRFQQAITPARESTPVKAPAPESMPPAYPRKSPAQPTSVGGSTPSRVPPVGVPAMDRVPPKTTAPPPPPPSTTASATTKAVPPQKVEVTSAPPSSFAHTGTGTVLWGASPNKANPSQMAYAAAMSRVSPKGPGAAGEPINPNLPPNVNIKNLDSMKSTMPPPVTFAAVASSVDADTAQVVTQVLSEITSTGGRAIPPPGTAVTDSPVGSTKPSETPTSADTSAAQPKQQGFSSKTFVIPPKEAVADAPKSGGALQTPVATSTPIDPVTTTAQPAKFDFNLKNDSSSVGASTTVPGGFFFGSKSTEGGPTSAGLPKADTTAGSSNKALSGTGLRGLLADDGPEGENRGPSSEETKSSAISKPPSAPISFSFGAAASSKPVFGGPVTSQPAFGGTTAASQPFFGGISTSHPPVSGAATSQPTLFGGSSTSTPIGGSSGFSFSQKPVTTLTSGSSSAFSQPAFGQASTTKVTTPAATATPTEKVTAAPNVVAPGGGKGLTTSAPSTLTPVSLQFGKTVSSSTAAANPEGETESAGPFVFAVNKGPSTTTTAPFMGTTSLGAPTASTPSVGMAPSSAGMKTTSSAPSLLTAMLKDGPGQPASTPDKGTASPGSVTVTTSAPFSTSSMAAASPFGAATAPATTAPASSGFSFGGGSTPAAPLFGSSGGFGSTTAAKPSLFGLATPSSGFGSASSAPTTTTGQSLFGQPTATTAQSLFGQPATTSQSGFGQAATFGSSGTPLFGQKPAFGQTSSASSASKSLFGQATPSSTSASSLFGQPAQSTPASSQSSIGGFGGFGLGGKPDPEAAKTNPFGVTSSTTGTAGPFGTANLFGSQGPKAFGSPTSTGSGFGGGAFSSSTAGVSTGGFGTQPASTAASSGFGAAPVFGGAPAFGSKPAFGSPPAFGSGAAFSNPLGQNTFGSSPSSGGPFGASANQSTPSAGFGGFASQNTPSFGGLASSPQGFGGAGGSGGFGSPQQTGFGGFGGSGSASFGNSNTAPSFGTSGSFSQYR